MTSPRTRTGYPRCSREQAYLTSRKSCFQATKPSDSTYKVHLDGYNLMPYLKGEVEAGPRKEFLYWTDDGEVAGLRYDKWKLVFMEQRRSEERRVGKECRS